MRLRAFLIGGLVMLTGLCLTVAVVNSIAAHVPPTSSPSTQAAAASPSPVGRFQVATSGPLLFMVDTTTGEVWQSNGSTRWQHIINPLPKTK